MATAIVPEATQSAVVVSFPSTKETITQNSLAEIVQLRQQIETLEGRLKIAEGDVRQKLEAGAHVEPGLLLAYLKTQERRNVAWRDVVERLKGAGYCENVLAHTKPTTSTRLVVEA